MFRHPRTQNERRANADKELAVRGKRKPARIPTAYDDLYRTLQRSWKSHRESQYKGVIHA